MHFISLQEYHIYINEFTAPNTLETLIIRNCKVLKILPRCSKFPWEKKNMKLLHISNIENLKIENIRGYQSLFPPRVIFENIGNIENIPENTFTQINKVFNQARCVLPNNVFNSLYFRNVSINTVQGQAFHMPNNFGNASFVNVRIKTLGPSSFIINHESKGEFIFENSAVDLVKPSAIHITGQKIVLSKNKFGEISSGGFKINTKTFDFINNSVHKFLHSQAFTIVSQRALVSSNHFKYLKTKAFSAMSASAGRFSTYEFSGNNIDYLEDDSLLPSMNSYKNLLTQVTFKKNKFSCECSQSGGYTTKSQLFTTPNKNYS